MTQVLQAPSSLLMGPAGSGKTTSLATYVEAGIELFVLFTEASGPDSLLDGLRRLRLDVSKVHWHVVTPSPPGWAALDKMATTIRAMSYEDMSKLKGGVEKASMKQMSQFLDSFADFPCDRTGRRFGDVTLWDDSRALAIDSLTGLNQLSWLNTVGYKPTAHEGEWGVAMNLEEQLIRKLTADCNCFFTIIAHIDREPDLISGGSKITAAALGRKLGPKLPTLFAEVIRAFNKSEGFTWSTIDEQADLKYRALERGTALKPSFAPIVDVHIRRRKEAQAEADAAPPQVAPALTPSAA